MLTHLNTRNSAFSTTRVSIVAAALLTSSMAFATTTPSERQGLYSADELLDADVYTSTEGTKSIGEIEDILLDDNMRVHAIVIETGNLLDLGEKQYVIETGNFSVNTVNSDNLDDLEYRVVVNLSEEAITQQPAYTDTWWNDARQNAQDAWEKTKEGASSAWNNTREATANVLERAEEALKPSEAKPETK
ncbi:PRC-barrel domain-containing protein [Halomonas halocynthiae]|uniref:PRC-barrel domain-containing protein n=1 Tax=Halomonas halocynthiae TaxID=176290 RepID=UPI000410BC77|nr:PRC-barrel domain-containing protein [Halomonas halocynthiae]